MLQLEGIIQTLENYIDQFPVILRKIPIQELEHKASSEKWSKKEILGHLIDSAINNLSRFIVAQHQDNPTILYDQVAWCKNNFYQKADIHRLIGLWESLNRQILFIWKNLPIESFEKKANNLTIAFLMEDYVAHFEHHFKQIIKETV